MISKTPLVKTIAVAHGSRIVLEGKIVTVTGEKKNPALVQIDFPGFVAGDELARQLRISFSKRAGFYKYLPVHNPGKQDWKIAFNLPPGCEHIKLKWTGWCNKYPIKIRLDHVVTNAPSRMAPREMLSRLQEIKQAQGTSQALAFIDALQPPPAIAADLYEKLADQEVPENRPQLYRQAFSADPDLARGSRLLRKATKAGSLSQAARLMKALVDRYADKAEALPSVAQTRGYLALQNKKPFIGPVLGTAPDWNEDKILYILYSSLPHHISGYTIRSHNVLTTLLRHTPYHVKAVTKPGYPQDTGIGCRQDVDIIDRVHYLRVKGANINRQGLDQYIQTASRQIEKLITKEKPALVHAASAFYSALPALIAARRLAIPFIYEVRGFWEITKAAIDPGWEQSELFRLQRDLEILVADQADRIIAISQGIKSELIHRGIDAAKITVIPNGVDPQQFKPRPPDPELKAKLGLGNLPVIGYIGSISSYEGLDILVAALVLLKARGTDFRLLLVGDGAYMSELRKLVSARRLDHETIFAGRIPYDKVQTWHSLVDIAVFPRKNLEVCSLVSPLKPFEAMAMQQAVIVSDLKALSKIVTNRKTGLLCKPGDSRDLADKLELVLKDPGLRVELGRAARKWILDHHDWAGLAPRFEQVYRQSLAEYPDNIQTRVQALNQKRPLSILVYGDINLNLLDGSSVWLSSLVENLARMPSVEVTLLLRTLPERPYLIEPLRRFANVTLISPADTRYNAEVLSPRQAVEIMAELQVANFYDCLIVRGNEVLKLAARNQARLGRLVAYLLEVFQTTDDSERLLQEIVPIVRASYQILCQTKFMIAHLEDRIPEARGKTCLLPPAVPDQPPLARSFPVEIDRSSR